MTNTNTDHTNTGHPWPAHWRDECVTLYVPRGTGRGSWLVAAAIIAAGGDPTITGDHADVIDVLNDFGIDTPM